MDVQTCSLMFSSCESRRALVRHPTARCSLADAYGTRDVIYDWKLDEHDGVELERLKLSQFDLFSYAISKRDIQLNDRMLKRCFASIEPTEKRNEFDRAMKPDSGMN